jgi:tetratricopeptide (TPR) repeat protein
MTFRERYSKCRDRGKRAILKGNFERAEVCFRESLEAARALGDTALTDLAVCNLSAALLEQNRTTEPEIGLLRLIYMRSCDPKTIRLAAYHLARSLELQKDFPKAYFYAKIALEKSGQLKKTDYLASSYNQLGNIHTCQSYFDQAVTCYARALELAPADNPVFRALVLDNLGYGHIILGRIDEGLRECGEALRILSEEAAQPGFLIYPHTDLCLGYLEAGDLDPAVHHGEEALRIAEAQHRPDRIKNILLLLGETHAKKNDVPAAQTYYGELAAYFPDVKFASDFLMAFELRKVVNFRL